MDKLIKELQLKQFTRNISFEKSLQKQFLRKATGNNGAIFGVPKIALPLFSTLLFVLVIVSVTIFSPLSPVENAYANSSQTLLSPLYYSLNINDYNNATLHRQMNFSQVPFDVNKKNSFNTSTALVVNRYEQLEMCPEALPYQNFVEEIRVQESYNAESTLYSYELSVISSNLEDNITYSYQNETLTFVNNSYVEEVREESLPIALSQNISRDFSKQDFEVDVLCGDTQLSPIRYSFEIEDNKSTLQARLDNELLFSIEVLQQDLN